MAAPVGDCRGLPAAPERGRSACAATSLLLGLLAAHGGCAPDDRLAAPEQQFPEPNPDAATAGDHVPGARVRLSPSGYVAFTRAGEDAEPLIFTAKLEDVAGAALPVPAGGLNWSLEPGRAFRMGATGVAEDGWAATARIEPVTGGRDSVIVRHGSAADTAFAENWEWLAAALEWDGGQWTSAGESLCAQIALQAGSLTAGLSDFDLYAASFDPAKLRVDSARVDPGGRSLRLCMTAQSSGKTSVALVGRNEARRQFWGWRRRHAVLEQPLTLAYEHGDEYEIGVGQREDLGARLSDRRGTAVLLDETEAVSWASDDASVAAVDSDGALRGRASGTVQVAMRYRDLNAQAAVDVYEITGGRVGEEIVCVSTRRGAVRCWGNSEAEPMMGYGVFFSNLGVVRPTQVADLPVGAGVRELLQAHSRGVCAITVLSDLRCWGAPNWGALGYGNPWTRIGAEEYPRDAGPVPLGGTPAYVGGGPADHFCVVLASGGLRCVGSNLTGQVGYGIPHSQEPIIGDDETPAQMGDVPLGGRAVHVATGGRAGMTCAALANGRGRCWGINAENWDPPATLVGKTYGLGYGRSRGYSSPIGDDETPADAGDLPLDGRILQFALGGFHVCALMEGGAVRCWGHNFDGELGAGLPKSVVVSDASKSTELVFPSPVVQIEAGWRHACVLMESGAVRCWGGNQDGTLGYGDTNGRGNLESAEFVEDVPLGGPAALLLGSGSYENCAVMRAGGLRCWGRNWNGHFGYPFREDVGDDETPAEVGDIMVFPGPVRPGRLGVGAGRASSRAGWFRPPEELGPARPTAPSVLVLDALGADPPWRGPLTGDDGVVLPDAVPASAVWTAVAGAGR